MAEGISKKTILRLSPDKIVADTEYNGRRYHDSEIEDLTMQIVEAGKLLQAVGVAGPYKTGEHKGKYRLWFGFRRFLAMSDIIAGGLAATDNESLTMIDCNLISDDPLDDKAAFLANLAENTDRKERTPMDDAVNLVRLIDEFGLSNADAAKAMRMKPSLASQRKTLAYLPVSLHKYIADGAISASVGYELSKLPVEEVEATAEKLIAEAKAAGGKRVTRDQMAESTRATAAEAPEGGEAPEGDAAPAKRARAVIKPRSVKAAFSFLSIYKLTDIKSEKGQRQLIVEFMEKVFAGVDEKKLKKEFDAILPN
jgi:hypothetical protein